MRLAKYIKETDETIDCVTDWRAIDYFNSIYEVFDSIHNVKITSDDGFMFTTVFVTHNTKYTFSARNNGNGEYTILFYPIDGDNLTFDLTRKLKYVGDVFSGVFQSMRLLIRKHETATVIFTSDDLHRPLYEKMSKWIEKRFPFKLEGKHQNGNMTIYVYKRIQE
jgi:hypothetical protein